MRKSIDKAKTVCGYRAEHDSFCPLLCRPLEAAAIGINARSGASNQVCCCAATPPRNQQESARHGHNPEPTAKLASAILTGEEKR
jgi:hypothetical protein